ncbi:hypothetical protein [Azohydromonas caseinilytica]|uniref:Glycoside hydrolase family 42 N-terminal domain-containing protein n=1 Tax=Azohydromonas caseinilytica TaxID=2728836 RepID=A0A848FBB4_9BURK|nr:hypothetical protein [Azohydromonas caseinilytica]NML16588.1 hypothetical protein [Azohydromonas caseinilytica]
MPALTRRQLLTAAAAACAPGLPHAESGGMKWHPGQYIHIPSRGGVAAIEDTLAQIRNIEAARGLQLRYTWAELEPSEGRYDFSRIRQDLERVGGAKKRLHVLLMLKSFGGGARPVPEYLEQKAERGRATFNIGIQEKQAPGGPRNRAGQNIALWEPRVLESLENFLLAMGRELDAHPALEGVAFNETSLGKADRDIGAEDKTQFFRNLASADRTLRKAFPSTVTLQFVNFPKEAIPILVGQMAEYGIGLGGPDIFLDDRSLRNNVYTQYPRLAGVVPLAPSVQYENYVALRHQGERTSVPLEDLYNFARNELRANYLFWTRPQQGLKNVWPEVLNFLKTHPQASTLTGGLATACPSAFRGGCRMG